MTYYVENETEVTFSFDVEKIVRQVAEAVLDSENCEYEVQLNEYYKYISKISNKNVKMYLLSLTKAKLKEVFVIQ
jgi:hypothetical protein